MRVRRRIHRIPHNSQSQWNAHFLLCLKFGVAVLFASIWFGTNVRTHLLLWILHSYFDAISGIVIHFSLHPSDQSNIPPPPPPSPAFYVPSIDGFMVVPHQYNTRRPFPPSVGRSRRPLQSVGRGGRSASHSRLRSRPSSDRARR